jgi:hypothetical protein
LPARTTRNRASTGLIERLGFARISTLPNADHFKGSDSDEYQCRLTPTPTSRQTADTFCATLKGVTRADPTTGELDSRKVGGKMFATFGERINGVFTKTDSVEIAQMLIDANAATKAPYFHRSCVLARLDAPRDELHHRLQKPLRHHPRQPAQKTAWHP